ncbi:MAG: exopolyphosphatase [Ferrimonas sp.]
MAAKRVDAVVNSLVGRPLLAAVTLGSNSFSLLLATPERGLPVIVAKHRRKVRLARGINDSGQLQPDAAAAGLACLAWFGQLLRQYQPQVVRVYATAALRQASDSAEFCQQAQTLLGHAIEIISGEQEARLIYQGMRATTHATHPRQLMLDIGGASTELVLGTEQIEGLCSLPLGAVLMTDRHFVRGVTVQGFANVALDLQQTMATSAPAMQQLLLNASNAPLQVLGLSGSFRGVFEWNQYHGRPEILYRAQIQQLKRRLLQGPITQIEGVDPERYATFAAGIAMIDALMTQLALEQIEPAGGALREGLLVQLNQLYWDQSVAPVAEFSS